MKLEKGRITGLQIMCAVSCFLHGTVLRSVFVISVTGRDSWAMAITGFLCFMPVLLVYYLLLKWFPGKSLFEINEEVFGKAAGKILSLVYLFFFLSLSALNLRDLGNFVVDFVMPETPDIAVLILFMVFCVYTVRKGLEGFMRIGVVFPLLSVLVIVLNFILVINDAEWGYLQPAFTEKFMVYVQGTHIVATIPFGELIVMMMVAPNIRKGENAAKYIFWGALMSAAFMVLVIIRDIISLGPLANIISLPSFEAVRTVNFADIITRTESFYALLLVSLMFIKLCILLYVTALGIAQIFELDHYRRLVCIVGVIIVCYSGFVFESSMENGYWGSHVTPFFWLLFQYILPLVTLAAARLRGMHRPNRQGEAASI